MFQCYMRQKYYDDFPNASTVANDMSATVAFSCDRIGFRLKETYPDPASFGEIPEHDGSVRFMITGRKVCPLFGRPVEEIS